MGFFGCSTAGSAEADFVEPAPPLAGFNVGCDLCAIAAAALAGTTLRVFVAGLDLAEVSVRTAGFDGAGGFVCGSKFPWDCGGELATGREATEACTFAAGAQPAWTPPDCCCIYHQPPPVRSKTPAAIAPIRI